MNEYMDGQKLIFNKELGPGEVLHTQKRRWSKKFLAIQRPSTAKNEEGI